VTDGLRLPADEGVRAALRSLASTYVGAQRAGGELRTRLVAIEQDRAKALAANQQREYGSASDRELAEIERVRRTLARSAAASAEHLRALEAVIAAVAGDAVRALGGVTPPAASPPVKAPDPLPVPRPDASLRGSWSAPGPDAGPGPRRLQ
jgi:hypothetical protein